MMVHPDTNPPSARSPKDRRALLAILHRISKISDRALFGFFFMVVASMIAEYGFYLDEALSDHIRSFSVAAVWLLVLDYLIKLTTAATASLLEKSWSHLRHHAVRKWPHLLVALIIVIQQMIFLGSIHVAIAESIDSGMWAQLYIAFSQVIIVAGFLAPLFKYGSRIAATRFHPSQSLVIGFLLLILIGSGGLMLPRATYPGCTLGVVDAVFTATSAVCVTGLTVVDTPSHFTMTGQFVLLILMQVGGVGIIAFATFFAMFFGSGMSFKERILIKDVLNEATYEDALKTLRQIIFVTFLLEGAGALGLYYTWPPPGPATPWHSPWEKIWYSVFHAVSAFCNAGFTLSSDSLMTIGHWPSLTVVASLIVFGGLGFSVIRNLISFGYARTVGRGLASIRRIIVRSALRQEQDTIAPQSRLKAVRSMLENYRTEISMQSKFVITVSIMLIVGGAVLLAALEWNDTLAGGAWPEKIIHAVFQSVSSRTAGFNTIDLSAFGVPAIIVLIFLMFIGASPGSTGGGIKTTTFATMLISSFGNLSGRDRIHVYGRQIPQVAVVRSLMVITFSTLFLTGAVFVLSITDSGMTIEKLFFEAVSAFATVGLSLGVTPALSVPGKIVIMISMFVGRLGTLSIAMSVTTPKISEKIYPEESVMIG